MDSYDKAVNQTVLMIERYSTKECHGSVPKVSNVVKELRYKSQERTQLGSTRQTQRSGRTAISFSLIHILGITDA
jgi:hypothetical protein